MLDSKVIEKINAAKVFVSQIENIENKVKIMKERSLCLQAEVAKIALEVCDIRHGGRCGDSVYTISKFAEDIGCERKTVSGWVQTYRDILLPSGVITPSQEEWTIGNKVSRQIQYINREANENEGTPGKKKRGPFPKKAVKRLYHEVKNNPKKALEQNLYKDTKRVLSNVRLLEFSNLQRGLLFKIEENLRQSLKHIEENKERTYE